MAVENMSTYKRKSTPNILGSTFSYLVSLNIGLLSPKKSHGQVSHILEVQTLSKSVLCFSPCLCLTLHMITC